MSKQRKQSNLPQVRVNLSLPDTRVLQERIAQSHRSKPMRVLVLFDGNNDRELDAVLADVSNRLHIRRHEVINVIAGKSGVFPSTQDFIVPPLPDLATKSAIPLAHKLTKIIAEYQPSMIIAGSSFTRHPAVVAAEASKKRPRVVLYKNEGLSELGLMARFNATMILPMADLIVATSKTAKEDILHYSSDLRIKTHAIYAPHISEDLKYRSQVSVEHDWFRNPTAPIFVMHEPITGSKNQISVINLIAELAREMPTRLMMFGKGRGKAALQRRIDKLDIPHLVSIQDPIDDASPFIAKANGFLRADPSTAIPRSMIESIHLGCPVISFKHDDAIEEAIGDTQSGVRIDKNSAEELGQAIRQAVGIIDRNPGTSSFQFEHENVIDQHVDACLSVRFLKRKEQTLRIGAAQKDKKTLLISK